MSPQFVDFDHDGHLDIVTATYDGSPHISLGSADGFAKPVHVLDDAGKRITLRQWYDWQAKAYQQATAQAPGRLTSALAFDWDGDGDFDLLLGDKEEGFLYLRRNHGTKTAAKFDREDIPVEAGGTQLKVEGGITSPRLVDLDRDGRVDLLIGSYGDSYAAKPGGGVYWFRNVGEPGSPKFATAVTLIEPSQKGATAPTRPDGGLYVDAGDYDGDGVIDLVVGAYSQWMPPPRGLTDTEKDELAALRAQQKAIAAETQRAGTLITPEQRQSLNERRTKVNQQIDALVPRAQRTPFVWLYRGIRE
jgi:hypothetical protein